MGRGNPEMVETCREICAGEYSGISGFSNVMSDRMSWHFKDKDEAQEILELVRYANVLSHKPLVEDELLFIARYPHTAKRLLTLTPLDGAF